MSRKPVVIDLEPKPKKRKAPKAKAVVKEVAQEVVASPADAPPVPDSDMPETGAAMHMVTQFSARRGSGLFRLFWAALLGLIGLFVSVALWDFVTSLLERNEILGWLAIGLAGLVLLAVLVAGLRELAAVSRVRKIDRLRLSSDGFLDNGTLKDTKEHTNRLSNLYSGRADMKWARAEYKDHVSDHMDRVRLMHFAERTLMTPLDIMAEREIETASRQVATATAIVPLALVDVVVALTTNLRMIRKIAEIYGGRGGRLGSWRLLRAVATHLVATGAVAIGDDMLGSIAGGGVLGKLSRRFGEGLVNGALTARVGIAAMEVCRPMSFSASKKPTVTALVKRALTGFFG